jgi:two-component system chemotaxis response regulator CheB
MTAELISKVKAASRSKVIHLNGRMNRPRAERKYSYHGVARGSHKIVAIGASSGGPYALRYLLPKITSDFDAGIVVVQHMPESFTSMLAHWLDELCELEVKEAAEGDVVCPGRVLIAPGRVHLKVARRAKVGEAVLEGSGSVNGHIPSVDVLFESVAREYGSGATAVIMTGMGRDGADGIGHIKRAGGRTIAQDRDSSAIFGMPRVAIEKGHIDEILPLDELAAHLMSVVGRSEEGG